MTRNWISEASNTLRIQVEVLSSQTTIDLFRRLRKEFADLDSKLPLWETIGEYVSRRRINGWRDIGEYVADSACFLATEANGEEAYRVCSGNDLTKLLSECPGFEFYVTNENYDFLLCHNHHDYLIGAGKAASWLETKSDDLGATSAIY